MVLNDVLWVFVKCGNQPWAEGPYNPNYSKYHPLQPVEDDTGGYGLTLVMVDAVTCTIWHLRLIGLGNEFSRRLYDDVQLLRDRPFDRRRHDKAIMTAQTTYSTEEMAQKCTNI